MTDTPASAKGLALPRWRNIQTTLEAVTLVVLVLPPLWIALHWRWIPAVTPHLRYGRMVLWVMPTFALFVYGMLGELGLLSRMDTLRRGHRLSSLRPLFTVYFLTLRLELLAFLAVLGLAMERTAVTGYWWPARGFVSASLTVIVLTVVLFIVVVTRASYRLTRTHF